MAFEGLEEKICDGATVKLVEFGQEIVGKVKYFDEVERRLALVKNGDDRLTLIMERDVTSCKVVDKSEDEGEMTEEQLKNIFEKANIKAKPDPLLRPRRNGDTSHLKAHHHIKMATLLTGAPPPIPDEPLPVYTDEDGREYYQLPAVVQTREHRINTEGMEVHGGITEKVIREKLWEKHKLYPLIITPTKMYFIDKIDAMFHWAVSKLKSCPRVGVSCLGSKISRSGVLSLIIFSTTEMVFIFDITTLHDNAFKGGLKEILESKTRHMTKIVHDVRPVVDILYHQYGISFDENSISDTMVNDLVFCQEYVHSGFVPATFRSLVSCLKDYLGIADFHMFYPRYRVNHRWDDEQVWFTRPLSKYMLLSAARTCLYLPSLHKMTKKGLELRFHQATIRSSRSLKGMDQVDKEAIYDDPKYYFPAVARLRRGPNYNLDPSRKPGHKIHEGSIHANVASHDPLCIYSKDSMHMTV